MAQVVQSEKRIRLSKRKRILLAGSCSLFLGICCLLPLWIKLEWEWPDIQIRRSLKPYPSKFLFEDFTYYGPFASETTLFYWTLDPVESAVNYYEKTFSATFVKGNEQGEWLIAGYYLDGSKSPIPYMSTTNINQSAFCHLPMIDPGPDYIGFKCVTVSLVKLGKPSICRLPIISPGNSAARWLPEPYTKCGRFPNTGTLIIYKYYSSEW
jgi:hypothetical protein